MPEREPLTQDDIERANVLVDEALRFVFDEYDLDHDGRISRSEFFGFLWKLKSESGYNLNEGQMISCWKAMDANEKGSVDFLEFCTGLEAIYDHYFYAVENGAPVPESHVKIPAPSSGEDASSYNTIRFKNSAAVAFFDKILQDERSTAQVAEQQRMEKAKSLAAPTTFTRRERSSAQLKVNVTPATPVEKPSPSADDPPQLAAAGGASVARNTSWAMRDNASDLTRKGSGLSRAGFNAVSQHDQERERKRKEAEEQLQKIMAERHKDERRKREEERQRKLEEARKQNEAAANEMLAEPSWKKNIKVTQRNL